MFVIISLAVMGFAVSLYGYIIEQKLKGDPTFKPLCDISDRMSCIKPLQSKYSALLGVSNSVVGMVFYVLLFICALFSLTFVVQLLSIIACMVSLGLSYVLYYKIRTLCLICTTIYSINGLLLVTSMTML